MRLFMPIEINIKLNPLQIIFKSVFEITKDYIKNK